MSELGIDGGSPIGGVGETNFNTEPGGPQADLGRVTSAADGVGNVQSAASRVAGGNPNDSFEVAQAQKRDGLKDGDWLHDPRQLTPGQARDLEQMLQRPDLHPDTKKDIEQFLDDYRNGRDRLFPESPNPLPRPYPWPKNPTQIG